eukprot:Rmarinus@m.5929
MYTRALRSTPRFATLARWSLMMRCSRRSLRVLLRRAKKAGWCRWATKSWKSSATRGPRRQWQNLQSVRFYSVAATATLIAPSTRCTSMHLRVVRTLLFLTRRSRRRSCAGMLSDSRRFLPTSLTGRHSTVTKKHRRRKLWYKLTWTRGTSP